jgi:SPP1 gp7 family putative phage head morphogenesis protein
MSTPQGRALRLIERYNTILSSAEDEALAIINRALASSYLKLERELRSKYPTLVANGSLSAIQRKLLLMAEIKDLLNLVSQSTDYQAQFEELLILANQEGQNLARELISVLGEGTIYQISAEIPLEAVRVAAEEQMRYLRRYGEDFAMRATEVVTQGLIQGWGVKRVEGILVQQLGLGKVRAEAIARTATLSAFNGATQEHYRVNQIELFQWVATADDRTCPVCVARSGNIYRLEATRPPAHVRCRCYQMPVQRKWFDNGRIKEAWIRDFHQKGLDALIAAGKKPNYGIAPFEKSNGLTEPPTPVWTPAKGFSV